MQQFNFSPIDFSRIPQQERQAQQNWYDSWSNMASNIGKDISDTAKDVGTAIDTQNQRDLAEEWKKKQWTNQVYNQYLQNRRYKTQQEQLAEEKLRNQTAADALRKQFLANHTYDSLAEYGPGAQFQYSAIENAPDLQTILSAGNTLSNIINQRDLLRQQQLEEQRASEGETLFNTIGGEMSSSGMDLGRMGEVYNEQFIKGQPVRTKQNRMSQLSQLKNWRDRLKAFSDAHPERMSPQMQERLFNLNAAIRYWNRRMGGAPVSF